MGLATISAGGSHPPAPRRSAADAGAVRQDLQRGQIFAATVAHELRNPLSAMRAAVQVLRAELRSAASSWAADVLTRQIDQMSRMTDDLVDATRWTLGKVRMRPQRLDVCDVVRDAAADVRAAVALRRLQFALVTPPEPLWADVDRQRLLQVLSNLLGNAVKNTEPGGRVTLSVGTDPGSIRLSVHDTGRGIAPDALPHVFDLFWQGHSSDASGLGIGLSVVRDIVARHEGRIDVLSDGLGHGSVFTVTLPSRAAPALYVPPVH
jgi:signal transduction histidine kinase